MKRTILSNPSNMKQRIKSRFLFTSKTLKLPDSDFKQWRWLCFSSWVEEWRSTYLNNDDNPYHRGCWYEIEWTEE